MRAGRAIRLPAAIVAATVVIGALAGQANAGRTFDSHVTARFDTSGSADYIKGAVTSESAGCERHRNIKIKRDPTGSAGYQTIDTVRTNDDGRYRYDPPNPIPNGYYKAVAVRKVLGAGTCTAARSKRVFVD